MTSIFRSTCAFYLLFSRSDSFVSHQNLQSLQSLQSLRNEQLEQLRQEHQEQLRQQEQLEQLRQEQQRHKQQQQQRAERLVLRPHQQTAAFGETKLTGGGAGLPPNHGNQVITH